MDRIPSKKRSKYLKLIIYAPKLLPFLLSRYCNDEFHEIECCDVAHPWSKSCIQTLLLLSKGSFKECFKIYAPLYLISAILRGRTVSYYCKKLPYEVLRSTIFLTTNCFCFMAFFCMTRNLFGGVSYWGSFLANIPGCFLSIIIERKQRRGLLALYLTNLAVETCFRMLVFRNKVTPFPNGEVLIFAIASSVYALLFKMNLLDGSFNHLFKMFVGPYEKVDVEHKKGHHRQSRIIKYYGMTTIILNNFLNACQNLFMSGRRHNRSHNKLLHFMKSFEIYLEKQLDQLSKSSKYKHHLCSHRYNCIIYPLFGFLQRFIVGFSLQFLIKCLGSLAVLFKKPKIIWKLLKSPVNMQLGLFLGSYVLIFRMVSCMFRWLFNMNSKLVSLLAGFASGWSMMFYKSSSIALYLIFKLIEILWMIGVKENKLPLIRSFDIILYTLSTSFVLFIALFEPHNLRPAYWKFLIKISDKRFLHVNRSLLDVFGTNSSLVDKAI